LDDQPRSAQRGEIEFRRKLVEQQLGGETHFTDEFDAAGIETILRDRVETTRLQFERWHEQGVLRGPYLEVGAERGQRALVAENLFDLRGIACDLSLDMLRSCAHYASRFGYEKLPLRLCCDATRLPLRPGALPFVFAYQTLHHFPEPALLTAQLQRVLMPGGAFWFSEEPYRQILHVNLYRMPSMYSEQSRRAGPLRRRLDRYCGARVCNETAYGIIENDDITLPQWRTALAKFDVCEARLHSSQGLTVPLFGGRPPRSWLAALLGGEIDGLCRKAGELTEPVADPAALLLCPECLAKGEEQGLTDRVCGSCGQAYPVVDGVLMLFTREQHRDLYAEIPVP